jgi:hypothetical protein
MDDVTPATRRMTYAELGRARGISAKSAERLVQRRRWPRQIGNDGIARVLVPFGEDRVTPRHQEPMTPPDVAERQGMTSAPDIGDVVREAIRDVVAPLSAQLERAEQEAATLRAEVIDLRLAEQTAANLAEYGTARAADLRKRLEAAEQRAGDERDRADRAEQRADDERGRTDQAEKRAEEEQGRADRECDRADRAEKRADEEHDRADRAEKRADDERARADRASARVQELTQAMAERAAAPPKPEPPRTRWQRFKAWRRGPA